VPFLDKNNTMNGAKKMFWVIQENLYAEYGYDVMMLALKRMNINHVIVKPVPNTNKIVLDNIEITAENTNSLPEAEIDASGKVMVFGGITLNKIASNRDWSPRTYLNDNFEFKVWKKGFGTENVLNGESLLFKIKNLSSWESPWDQVFIRPTGDAKEFTGRLMGVAELSAWVGHVNKIEDGNFVRLNKNTEVALAGFKHIITESRLFVVDGQVITASYYKRGAKVVYDCLVDDEIITFGQKMVDKWQPAKAFVIDIAQTDKGLKVVEISNINSAGFYACDVHLIMEALINMETKNN
jgi:hypothetical protein